MQHVIYSSMDSRLGRTFGGFPSSLWPLATFPLTPFHAFCRRKTVTAWDTAIAPLDGEELIVEVLEDVPLTMHNFVSGEWGQTVGMVGESVTRLQPSLLCGNRYGRRSSAWPFVTSALSFCSMASAAKPVDTSSTNIVPPRSPQSVST